MSEVTLRRAALAYAAVTNLDPSDPRWRRCWRAVLVAAVRRTNEGLTQALDATTLGVAQGQRWSWRPGEQIS